MTFLLNFIQTIFLVAIVYFSAALAFQINAGGDVEYYISLFIFIAAVGYAFLATKK